MTGENYASVKFQILLQNAGLNGETMKKAIIFSTLIFGVVFSGCFKKEVIVAEVGSEKISMEMVKERLNETSPFYRNFFTSDAGKKQFLDLLIREKIIVEASKKAGVEATKEFKTSMDEFNKESAKKAKEFRDNMRIELFVKELQKGVLQVTEKDINDYYITNKAEFEKPLEVMAKHILLPSKELAEKAMRRIKSGESFAKVASEMSIDPVSANKGGQIGPFKRGDLLPEFEKALFPLKVGQIAEIVQTQFGFHIIMKSSQKVASSIPYQQAKELIKRSLEKNKFDLWLDATKKKLGIKIDYDSLAKVAVDNASFSENKANTQSAE